jgi:hypothetical protein
MPNAWNTNADTKPTAVGFGSTGNKNVAEFSVRWVTLGWATGAPAQKNKAVDAV